jgi:excisionase family DNA binding protein
MHARFVTMKQVAEELSLSEAQVYALVRSKDLPAVRIGGRGQWRIERARLEEWIERLYRDTERFIDEHPFTGAGDERTSDPPPAELTTCGATAIGVHPPHQANAAGQRRWFSTRRRRRRPRRQPWPGRPLRSRSGTPLRRGAQRVRHRWT